MTMQFQIALFEGRLWGRDGKNDVTIDDVVCIMMQIIKHPDPKKWKCSPSLREDMKTFRIMLAGATFLVMKRRCNHGNDVNVCLIEIVCVSISTCEHCKRRRLLYFLKAIEGATLRA